MRSTASLTLALACALGACSDAGESPTEPRAQTAALTVDASAGFAYVDFNGNSAQLIQVSDPTQASNWDIGFQATSVVLNSDTSGPGNVVGYCICQNANASADQVMAFSPTTENTDFEAITAAQAPTSAAAWQSNVFATAKWYRYNLTGNDHQVWPTFDVYLIKSGSDIYKLQLTNYYGPGGEPRRISFRYARLTR